MHTSPPSDHPLWGWINLGPRPDGARECARGLQPEPGAPAKGERAGGWGSEPAAPEPALTVPSLTPRRAKPGWNSHSRRGPLTSEGPGPHPRAGGGPAGRRRVRRRARFQGHGSAGDTAERRLAQRPGRRAGWNATGGRPPRVTRGWARTGPGGRGSVSQPRAASWGEGGARGCAVCHPRGAANRPNPERGDRDAGQGRGAECREMSDGGGHKGLGAVPGSDPRGGQRGRPGVRDAPPPGAQRAAEAANPDRPPQGASGPRACGCT